MQKQPVPQGPGGRMPAPAQMNAQPPVQQLNYSDMSPAQKYMMATQRLMPAVTEKNPHLKDQVGQCIYDFVVLNIGPDLAPKITGMLISLPVSEIRGFMSSYEALQAKTIEAREHLMDSLNKDKKQQ